MASFWSPMLLNHHVLHPGMHTWSPTTAAASLIELEPKAHPPAAEIDPVGLGVHALHAL